MFNFLVISRMMLAAGAAVQVDGEEPLARQLQAWFSDASERARVGELGRSVVEANRGALERLLALVEARL